MSKPSLPLFSLFLLFTLVASAQQSIPPCGFDGMHRRLLKADPEYARKLSENKAAIQRFITTHPPKKGLAARPQASYVIPVVVHVMHTGGAVGTTYNPDDSQILGAINYLNQVYGGTLNGMTPPAEGGGIVNMEIQFALAQRTPSCGSTNGIDRVDASSIPNYVANGVNANGTTGCSDLTLKNFARWNAADYYNIWVVNKIDGRDGTSGQFIAGYAYFAGASASVDGTVMLATQMRNGQKTLPHEIGHAMNLYHTFEDSNDDTDCPVNSSCATTGDEVCDTDPVTMNFNVGTQLYDFTCRTGANSCASPNNYSINTESNFMSYTNCYTLFTNGQKARVQAAMSLPSRASLVAGSNLALTPCGTSINFTLASSAQAEDPSGTLTGCRRYRDFNYQMAIGGAPSATAIATLTYGGTAIKGIDYDVTTNGNFSSPSNTLTFQSGSTTAQSFTVRIYDDADVESAETAVIDFTLNNGGGDATIGTTTPTLTINLADNDASPTGASSGTYSIGVVTSNANQTPFDARQAAARVQFIYRASELSAAGVLPGNLTSLQLYVSTKATTRPFTNFSVKMAHTSLDYLVDGSINAVNGMTTVYSTASLSTVAAWNLFTFTSPFTWNGTSNIAIELCYDNGAISAGSGADLVRLYADGGAMTQGSTMWQNGVNCAQSFSSVSYFQFGRKPIVRIGNNVVGTSIETAAGATASLNIGAGSSDYFYSNNNKLLMRLTGVNGSLGCVNASVAAGGTTWSNYQGGQRSAKVFAVTPTSNGGATSYTIALYFDNAELAGKTASQLRIAKTSAASVAASNVSNTVLVTPTVTTLGSSTTVFTASFTGFSQFFLVDAGVALAVEFASFSGKLTAEQNALLEWKTASEQDNRGFDIELSRDAIHFEHIGHVASQGNAAHAQAYSFEHLYPSWGTNYYRLKQTDLDGKVTYSKIISVEVPVPQTKASVYPVPANDVVTVKFGEVISKGEIHVLSADLRILRKEKISGPHTGQDINIAHLQSGLYFIRVMDEKGAELLRFIKQ